MIPHSFTFAVHNEWESFLERREQEKSVSVKLKDNLIRASYGASKKNREKRVFILKSRVFEARLNAGT